MWMALCSSKVGKKKGKNISQNELERRKFTLKQNKESSLRSLKGRGGGSSTKCTLRKWEYETCGWTGGAYILHPLFSGIMKAARLHVPLALNIHPVAGGQSWTGCSWPVCRDWSQSHSLFSVLQNKIRISITNYFLLHCITEALLL